MERELRQPALGRFSRLRRIGEGGFGIVFAGHDPVYRCDVALKLLRHDRIDALQAFKREFRELAELTHPNLVRLYELQAEGNDAWFFTMELVEGQTFLEYAGAVEPREGTTLEDPPPASFERRIVKPLPVHALQDVARQLAEGVHALHEARKLHCDLKPSNVLVTRAGRVVILDFGLLRDRDSRSARPHGWAGTPGYMAPELSSGVASPSSDWFAVGVMLHEAMTGSLPREQPDRTKPPSDSHALLWALASDLLAPEPAVRPSGIDVLRRLTPQDRRTPAASIAPVAFIGRRQELAQLEEARQAVSVGHPVVARLVAVSGMGKSALARQFVQRVREQQPDWIVLVGRCYEQELVPYKSLDDVIDALVGELLDLPAAERVELLPPGAERLPRLFPAFRRIIARADGPPQVEELAQQRQLAFGVLKELIRSLARRRPLLVWIDDLHAGDVDGARLLAEILKPPGPQLLLLASHRPIGVSPGFLDTFDAASAGVTERRVELRELSSEEGRAMASEVLGPEAQALVDAVASEGAGYPLFIQQLAYSALASGGHQPALSLANLIAQRVQSLDPDARQLVETLAVAAQPIDEAVALAAADLDGAASQRATSATRNARLLLSRGGKVELIHDKVREAVVTSTSPGARRAYHRRLADALSARPDAEAETLAHHYEHGGEPAQARKHALKAATRAESAFAFEQAAQHLSIAVRCLAPGDPSHWQLLERRAHALANAGRGGDAGDEFQAAADVLASVAPSRPEVATLARRAGEQSLRSGRLEVGTQRMQDALRRVGVRMPTSRTTAGMLAIGRRLRLFARGMQPRKVGRRQATEGEVAKLDALWAASTGVSMVNHVLADALGLEHLLTALDVEAGPHLVRGLGYEAAFEAVIGGPLFARRCLSILAQMDALADRSREPYDVAWARMSRGIASWFLGDWQAAWSHCDDASSLYRTKCRGVAWELAICDAYRLPGLAYLGDLPKLADLVPRALEGARQRGDLFAASTLRLGQQSLVLLARDRPGEALSDADDAVSTFTNTTYLLPHYHCLFAKVQAHLYRGTPAEAWRAIEHDWRSLQGARLLNVQCLRVEIRHLRARAALALVAAGPRDAEWTRDRLLRDVAQQIAILERDPVPPARPFAAALRAALLANTGRQGEAMRWLRASLDGFIAADMHLYANALRTRLGAAVGGVEGSALQTAAARWMESRLVVNPTAMTEMLAPSC